MAETAQPAGAARRPAATTGFPAAESAAVQASGPGRAMGALPAGAGPALVAGLAGQFARPAEGFWRASVKRFMRNRMSVAALVVIVILLALSFSAPLIAAARGVSRDAIELLDQYQAPSSAHWFGTDEYGRDYFTRLLYGGQVSILMGLGVTLIVLCIAMPFGILAGYHGGLIDDAFNWLVQIIVTVPVLFVLILVAAWIPPSPVSLALIIAAVSWTGEARQARGLTLQLKRTDYVLAARALGAKHSRIMLRHIAPNIVSLMIVLAAFQVVGGILAEVGLSFLGLGIRPPLPSWGNMLTNSLNYVFRAPHLVVFPGVAVALLVLCVYTIADGVRDAFDPRLKE
jgi:ABC-type dipeptide/oligopeptide/nickel transport system permease subunit